MSSFFQRFIVLFTIFTFASATCYWPTGNATYGRDLYEHQPCSNDTTNPLSTICCALNRTNISGGDKLNGRTNDECLPNGVCRNRVLDHGTMEVSYWRETCTSKDWKTGLCLDICSDNWTSGNGTTGAIMTPCDGTSGSLTWCCGVDTSCCKDPKQVKVLPFEFRGAIPNTSQDRVAQISTSTASSTTSSAASTTTAAVTTIPTKELEKEGESSGSLSPGAKAGIGISAVIGGLGLLGLGFFIARRTANKKKEPVPIQPQATEKQLHRYELDQHMRTELPYSPLSQLTDGKPISPSYEMA